MFANDIEFNNCGAFSSRKSFIFSLASLTSSPFKKSELINLPGQITGCWDSYEKYDQWLLRSMLYPKKIIKQVKKIYEQNAEEITRLLGDDDPSYVADFSADFLSSNGINVPSK